MESADTMMESADTRNVPSPRGPVPHVTTLSQRLAGRYGSLALKNDLSFTRFFSSLVNVGAS
jgi:hypothetical protein